MSTDPLAELARRARGPTPDPAWDALCRGELSEEERAALLAGEGAEELAPLFEPLGPDLTRRLADQVLAARRLTEAGAVPPPAVAPDPAPAAAPDPARAGHLRVLPPLPPAPPAPRPAPAAAPWRRVAVAAVALAAASLLYVLLPSGGEGPLPAYTLESHAGDRALRGEEPAGTRVSRGGRVTLLARPAQDAGPVEVKASLRPAGGGEPLPWGGTIEVSPTGSVRLSGVVGEELALAPGDWVVELTLTRPGDEAEALRLTSPLTIAP